MSKRSKKHAPFASGVEPLIELARGADGRFTLACGGDTFNTAIYLARAGIDVAFADCGRRRSMHSDSMMALATAEGVSSHLILRVPGRLPALGLAENSPSGERVNPLLARWRAGARAFRASRLDACRREPRFGKAHLFHRDHAVALFQHRSRPLPRGSGSCSSARRQSGFRRQFPPARLERRPGAHAHRFRRSAQARRHCIAGVR